MNNVENSPNLGGLIEKIVENSVENAEKSLLKPTFFRESKKDKVTVFLLKVFTEYDLIYFL